MRIHRSGIIMLVALLLMITGLFLPGIKIADPKMTLYGWELLLFETSAVFSFENDALGLMLGLLFIGNLLVIASIAAFPFLKIRALRVAFWCCMPASVFATGTTLYLLPNTHFVTGHYSWLTGMYLSTLAIAWKKREQAGVAVH